MARLQATALAARSVLDGRGHDGLLGRASKRENRRTSKNKITLTRMRGS
jgi:hypothetical protein